MKSCISSSWDAMINDLEIFLPVRDTKYLEKFLITRKNPPVIARDQLRRYLRCDGNDHSNVTKRWRWKGKFPTITIHNETQHTTPIEILVPLSSEFPIEFVKAFPWRIYTKTKVLLSVSYLAENTWGITCRFFKDFPAIPVDEMEWKKRLT